LRALVSRERGRDFGADSELDELDDCWELDFDPDFEAEIDLLRERDFDFDSLDDEDEDEDDELDEVDFELELDSDDDELECEHSSLAQISADFGAWHSWSRTMKSW
jgi:hypothetical protein